MSTDPQIHTGIYMCSITERSLFTLMSKGFQTITIIQPKGLESDKKTFEPFRHRRFKIINQGNIMLSNYIQPCSPHKKSYSSLLGLALCLVQLLCQTMSWPLRSSVISPVLAVTFHPLRHIRQKQALFIQQLALSIFTVRFRHRFSFKNWIK